jgi:hypothetical protein
MKERRKCNKSVCEGYLPWFYASGSKSGGSRDDGSREGYWIIRNQWSAYWGYDGYIFVAMGDNTCGVLNDMTQVYM